jgi:uncharacterized protein YbjT (DUF2867 family)
MNALDRVVVIGGTGRVGRLVADAVAAAGGAVRIAGRHVRSGSGDPGHEFVQASITDENAIGEAVADATGVVITVESSARNSDANGPHRVHADGVRWVAQAAPADAHIVLITQIYMTRVDEHPEFAPYIEARTIGEATVRDRPGPYTIIRPAWLTNSRPSAVRLEQGDRGDGQVSRANVAAAVTAALAHSPASRRTTFEIFDANRGEEPPRWPELFGTLQPDTAPSHLPRGGS